MNIKSQAVLQQAISLQQTHNLHPDLEQFEACKRDDSDATLVCYFEPETSNLWHVYVEGKEIFNLLSDVVIQALEREYRKHCREEAAQHNLDIAVARWESECLQ